MSILQRLLFLARSYWNHRPAQEIWLMARAWIPVFAALFLSLPWLRERTLAGTLAAFVAFALAGCVGWVVVVAGAARLAQFEREDGPYLG